MSGQKRYVAVYERDPESDAWLVHVDGIPECHTHGRSLRQAETRIREALAAWLDRDPDDLDIDEQWPPDVADLANEVARARDRALEAADEAGERTTAAARQLESLGLSRRDTAEILGISHQRVQQLLAG